MPRKCSPAHRSGEARRPSSGWTRGRVSYDFYSRVFLIADEHVPQELDEYGYRRDDQGSAIRRVHHDRGHVSKSKSGDAMLINNF